MLSLVLTLVTIAAAGSAAAPARKAAPATSAKPAPTGRAAKPASASSPADLQRLGRGVVALRAGEHARARSQLDGLPERLRRNTDYAAYALAEAWFYDGAPERAVELFERVARDKSSRFAGIAAWRAADARWAAGAKADAVARYRTLLARGPSGGDPAVARYRVATRALDEAERVSDAARSARLREDARVLLRALHVEQPGHPLAEAAAARLATLPPAPGSGAAPVATTVAERLRRAATLSETREWQAALDELDRLPADLPPPERAERDFLKGMTKYRMRRDYAGAAALLLGAVPDLAGDKAATAAFHGARALSRADRDDEAIVGYDRVVERFGSSRWAAEAQFLGGWLDFNRGRFRDGLPRLEATVRKFGRTSFALDASWFITLARYLLGEAERADAALSEYERRRAATAGADRVDANLRIAYFRARIAGKLGRPEEERTRLRALARSAPLAYYGLVARARLVDLGEPDKLELPSDVPSVTAATNALPVPEPALARFDELAAAGLPDEAAHELGRDEAGLLKRHGNAKALPILLDRYAKTEAYARAYRLAEVRGGPALATQPVGAARSVWEAAYPLAYQPLVEKFGPATGNPDELLYAIMRKESGFYPYDTSYADARGLLQMIPPTSARVAKGLGRAFSPDELYEPEVNVELGANYIGALHRKFRNQVPLTAGAYNAGPRAMMRWCEGNGTRPFDEFVELVSYEQTREYIKRVSAIYARYRFLYGRAAWLPPKRVDCGFDRAGPDF